MAASEAGWEGNDMLGAELAGLKRPGDETGVLLAVRGGGWTATRGCGRGADGGGRGAAAAGPWLEGGRLWQRLAVDMLRSTGAWAL